MMHPLKTSITVSFAYIFICSLYIWFSGVIAAQMSQSLPGLQSLELYKGLGFVIITGLMMFLFVQQLLTRIQKQNRELEEQRKALVEAQAKAITGTIAAGIAHDINNVLGIIGFDIDELLDVVPENKKNHIDRISKAFSMIRDMASRMQKIGKARIDNLEMISTNIGEFVQQTVDFAKRHRKIKSCAVLFKQSELIILNVNTFLVEQMIINLMLNAADATESKGKIEVILIDKSNHIFIEVHDSGPGITEEQRANLFRPYYTTKSEGTGLGLITVKTCTELHGGLVEIDKSHLGGALFRVVLPIKSHIRNIV
jgi:two-component system sensor histidine kinase HydH